MKPLLLDTNILIKFLRGDGKIGEVISRYERILVPTVVVGEYKAGIEPETASGRIQLDALDNFLDSPFVRVMAITEEVSDTYARVFRVLKANGTPIPQNDLWIAACAVVAGSAVFSLDNHFSFVPLLECVKIAFVLLDA